MNTGALYDAITGARLYTVREAAAVLGFHPFSVYRLACKGALRYRRLGPKTLLFSRDYNRARTDRVARAGEYLRMVALDAAGNLDARVPKV